MPVESAVSVIGVSPPPETGRGQATRSGPSRRASEMERLVSVGSGGSRPSCPRPLRASADCGLRLCSGL